MTNDLESRSPLPAPRSAAAMPAKEVCIDFGIYPLMNENTLDATTLAACCWGFLAARK